MNRGQDEITSSDEKEIRQGESSQCQMREQQSYRLSEYEKLLFFPHLRKAVNLRLIHHSAEFERRAQKLKTRQTCVGAHISERKREQSTAEKGKGKEERRAECYGGGPL